MDKDDANFVDVIHTAAKRLVGTTGNVGMLAPIGNVDFYPNGGEIQPGCSPIDPNCSHRASILLFINSIKNKCKYKSYPCSSTDDYYRGDCLKCGVNNCNQMGYYALPKQKQQTLYLDTKSVLKENNCVQNFQVKLISNDVGNKVAKGKFSIYLKSLKETSSIEVLDNEKVVFKSNSTERFLLSLGKILNDRKITKAFIRYERGWNIIGYEIRWQFKQIEITSFDGNKSIKLCPIDSLFGLSETIEYVRC